MKIALVLTVKNEARILRNNLLYHKAIGVDKAFVYFDNTTDKGMESISDLEFVRCENSIPIEKYKSLGYLKKITTQAKQHHTARQCLNTFDAQQHCKKEGIDWLISIDADELICIDYKKPTALNSFFSRIDSKVEVIYFKTLEVLQRKEKYENVFRDETLFKANQIAFHKNILNPFKKSNQKFSWWYGQNMGKGAIRIASEIIPHNVHRFKKTDGSNPILLNKGKILHYHAYDAEDFIKKFTNFSDHPDTFLSGNKVESLKLLLRDIVNFSGLKKTQLENYFKDNILFSEKEIAKAKTGRKYFFIKIKPLPLMEITSVQLVFQNVIET